MANSGSILTTAPSATELGQVVRGAGVFATTSGAGSAATSVVSRVAANAANVTLLALNAARRGACIYNGSIQQLYLKLGAAAAIGAGVESFTIRLFTDDYYEVPFGYTGIIDGIWSAADATGEALITELT